MLVNSICPSLYDNNYYVIRFINPTEHKILIPEDLINQDYSFINALEELINNPDYIDPYDFITIKVKY